MMMFSFGANRPKMFCPIPNLSCMQVEEKHLSTFTGLNIFVDGIISEKKVAKL
jgi:hypothetical protein